VAEGARRIRTHAEATQRIATDLVRLSTTLGSLASRLQGPSPNASVPLSPIGETS
jgi:hypothetical protein